MNIIWLSDYNVEDYLGGAELTDFYWIKKGREQGLTISTSTSDIPQADHYILSNCTKFKQEDILRLPSYSIITHGIPHLSAEVYKKAKSCCFMAPSHKKMYESLNENSFYSPPYIDSKKFYPIIREVPQRNLYVGWILEHKGILNILDYADRSKVPVDFYGRGNDDIMDKIRSRGCQVYPEVSQDELVEVYNNYDKFVWILKRYGSYGRTLVEAMLCGKKLIIDSKNFGLFSYKWDFTSRDCIITELETEYQNFWTHLLDI